ncbi:MAG: tRNA lysidine(34) synthetase TilS [Elusimicrobia bacterium]|nr:tRNA lysidine(34) synthetase TilS [Elusimicrobiota bacterium]
MTRTGNGEISEKSFSAKIWGALLSFSRQRRLLERGDTVLAGVSGGPDSVCLLHFLKSMEKRWGLSVAACHVHHGLRGAGADRDEKFVQKLCGELGVPLFAARVKVRPYASRNGLSLEHAARKLRYETFAACARKIGAGKVAVGHHLDDQVETVLLHLVRGGGPAGLGGMPVSRSLEGGRRGVTLVRPLMCMTRADVSLYLKRHRLSSVKDESNESDVHTRNWIRRKLLPLLESRQPRFRQHILGLSEAVSALKLPSQKNRG